ncbi:putative transcription initiation factor IIB [Scheffersomyces coipomensis]|uniref:putative transcription initiation factor IIB n=1 Tax=Scheffersomyces coipomensis TaxID=1788519 RepID=UPI00315C92FE
MSNNNGLSGPNLNVRIICPDCKTFPPDLIERFSEGDIVCGSCGLVLSDRIVDTRSEWRTFSNDDQNGDDPSRVGDAGNPLFDTEDLSTAISFSPEAGRTGRDLNRAQSKSLVDKKDNALAAAYAKISQMCDGYQLPKIVQDGAKEVYKLVYDEKSLRGKSQESIMAASVFIGCRKANMSRNFGEISALTSIKAEDIGKMVKIVSKIVQHKVNSDPHSNFYLEEAANNSQTSLTDLIRRICSSLGLNNKVTIAAEYIAQRCKEEDILTGRSPNTIAGAGIYMATLVYQAGTPIQSICIKSAIGQGTLKVAYKIIKAEQDKLTDPNWFVHDDSV